MINKSFLRYLCCPKCKKSLKCKDNILLCINCKFIYHIREDIPILIDPKSIKGHLRQQIDYFEKESDNRKKYKLEEWQKSYIRRFDENFNRKKGELLIDEGTGQGYIAVEMAKKGLQVIACDLTFKSLLRLKTIIKEKHLENNLFLVCCTAENLPLKNNIANYLVASAVLEHLPKEKEAIEGINRVCKKQSGLMITVPLNYRYLNTFLIPLNIIHDKKIGHLRRYDLEILQKKFNKWKVIKTYYTGHFLKVIRVIINIFFKLFNEYNIEQEDREKENIKCGASNLCVLFIRK